MESMPSKRFSPRFSITTKLLAWCVLLIAIFYAITAALMGRIKEIETLSSNIIGVHYKVVENSEIMAQQLITLLENKRRFEILGTAEHRQAYFRTLSEYQDRLREMLRLYPDIPEPWDTLYASLQSYLPEGWEERVDENGQTLAGQAPVTEPESLIRPGYTPAPVTQGQALQGDPAAPIGPPDFLPDDAVNKWLEILAKARVDNRKQMESGIMRLYDKARRAERTGFLGLTASLAIGIAGSLLIAFLLGRGLSELKRGIRRLGREGRLEPIRVLTSDELGELAQAFNRMTDQLRHEEQMRSDFISMLSHEIRTPLTSIREAVNLVKGGVLGDINEKQRKFLEISGKEVNRLSSLLTRLMNVSSLEARDMVLDLQPADPGALTAETSERMQPTAEAKGIVILVDSPDHLPQIKADTENVRQVLLNLIGNALKFSPARSVVMVRLKSDEPGQRVIFCVTDQGPGIPVEEQPFVFRKYYRAKGVRNSVDGAGLGLSISKRIVDAHGGDMWLESSPGQGSSFCFSLPSV
ncbi:signal transduction histidine kinase [Desulfocurvibacter africanus PCS]|uniref:histidine kinase n=2 Tax=Desulfocurvibacter africanus TaxID=873 RepID=M5PSL5_DESAF|nr:signal transduction histidine kinase [Desulfocurvibacter africanus PCS]